MFPQSRVSVNDCTNPIIPAAEITMCRTEIFVYAICLPLIQGLAHLGQIKRHKSGQSQPAKKTMMQRSVNPTKKQKQVTQHKLMWGWRIFYFESWTDFFDRALYRLDSALYLEKSPTRITPSVIDLIFQPQTGRCKSKYSHVRKGALYSRSGHCQKATCWQRFAGRK